MVVVPKVVVVKVVVLKVVVVKVVVLLGLMGVKVVIGLPLRSGDCDGL